MGVVVPAGELIAGFVRLRRASHRVIALETCSHPRQERASGRPGDAMQHGPIEFSPELAERRHVRSRERHPASLRVERSELDITVEHGEKPRQFARLPRQWHNEGVTAVVRWTECHPCFTGRPTARPGWSNTEIERLAILFGRARQGREPLAVAHETPPHLRERTAKRPRSPQEKTASVNPRGSWVQGKELVCASVGAKAPTAPVTRPSVEDRSGRKTSEPSSPA